MVMSIIIRLSCWNFTVVYYLSQRLLLRIVKCCLK